MKPTHSMTGQNNMVDQQRAIRDLEREKSEAKKLFESEQNDMAKRLYKMRRNLAVDAVGLDRQKINMARDILEVRGSFIGGGDARASVVNDAIRVLIDGTSDLQRNYFGTKSYDRWHGQRCDCEYGFGPRHGSIIFYVGLRPEWRNANLSSTQIEACVYFLTCIEAIENAEKGVTR